MGATVRKLSTQLAFALAPADPPGIFAARRGCAGGGLGGGWVERVVTHVTELDDADLPELVDDGVRSVVLHNHLHQLHLLRAPHVAHACALS